MWVLPPLIVELLPATVAVATAFGAWRLALYAKLHAHDRADS